MSGEYLGDFTPLQTVRFLWSTNGANGASITRATNGTVSVYKDNGTTQTTTGITDTEDFDSLTGVHACAVDLTSDTSFYSMGSDFAVVLSGATIDGQSVNAVLAHFSILNRGIPPMAKGRFQSGSSSTTGVLAAAESFGDDDLNGAQVYNLTQKEIRLVVDSVGSTDTVTVDPAWGTTPSSGEPYVVLPSAPAATSAAYADPANVVAWSGTAVATPDTAGYPKVTLKEGTGTGEMDRLVDKNWDELRSGHTTSGTFGQGAASVQGNVTGNLVGDVQGSLAGGIDAAGRGDIANTVWATGTRALTDKAGFSLSSAGVQAIWDALTSALTTAGSIGKRIADNLDAAITSRHASGAAVASVSGAVGSVTGDVGGNLLGTLSTTERNAIADAYLDRANAIETGLTPRQAHRLEAAAAAGKLSGGGTATEVIRNAVADSKARITASVDSAGNRTAITTDVT